MSRLDEYGCRIAKIVMIIIALKKTGDEKVFQFLKPHSRPRLTGATSILTRAQREEISREKKLRMLVCTQFLLMKKS